MATTKETDKKSDVKADSTNESNELSAIAVKSLTNLEEKVDAIDWKLWEIYNIVKNYVESNPSSGAAVPIVAQPQPSTAEIAAEVAKALGTTEEPKEKKSVVGKLFGK
jgi:hypothetical protein